MSRPLGTSAHPVVVVGGGPVGLVAALLLATRGVPTTLVERDVEPSGLPRAVHLDDEALRILDEVGVLASLAADAVPAPAYELRDGAGRLLHAIRRRPAARPPSTMFHQPTAEAALREAVRREPLVDARWGWEVTAVQPRPARVVCRRPDGAEQVLDAAAVLACDGATSTVRRLLELPVHDLGFDQTWAVVDVDLATRPAALAHPQQRCDPARPATSVPTGARRHRFEFMVLPGERGADLLEPDALEELLRSWGVDPAAVAVERAAVYDFHALAARRWRAGDVFLLGDAAHQMPPFLGQGLGTGLRDAANLAWKVALVQQGLADDALLDTYERERRAQTWVLIALTVLLGRFVTARSTAGDRIRRVVAAAVRATPPLRAALDGFRPPALRRGPLVARGWAGGVAGHPLPAWPLRTAGGELPEAAVLGSGFALIGLGKDPLAGADESTRRIWSALGARRVVLRPPGEPTERAAHEVVEAVDVTGRLTAWLAEAGAQLAVVRPDRVVLGTGQAEDLPRLTARLAPLLGRGGRARR